MRYDDHHFFLPFEFRLGLFAVGVGECLSAKGLGGRSFEDHEFLAEMVEQGFEHGGNGLAFIDGFVLEGNVGVGVVDADAVVVGGDENHESKIVLEVNAFFSDVIGENKGAV